MKRPALGKRERERLTAYGAAALFVLCLCVTALFHANIASLFAAATSSISGAPATMYFAPYDGNESLTVGQTIDLDLDLDANLPVNAVGSTISFPTDMLEVVGISKAKSFLNLWTEDTSIDEDAGELHFSGGTTAQGGMLGTSTVLTISVRAKAPGKATLSVKDLQVLAADGKGTALDTLAHPITFAIAAPAPPAAAAPSGSSVLSALPTPSAPSADLNGDGVVNIFDLSIMVIHLLGNYDPRYDLDMNGSVGLSDLSVLMSQIGSR